MNLNSENNKIYTLKIKVKKIKNNNNIEVVLEPPQLLATIKQDRTLIIKMIYLAISLFIAVFIFY
jgi:hypothetical protein